MKNTKKMLSVLMIAMLALSCMVLTSCGTKTLEEYINSDSDLKKEVESFSTDNMTVKVKDNNLTFEYKFEDMELTDDLRTTLKAEIEKQMDTQDSQFENIAKEMEDETGISGIKVVVRYVESDGTVLYENSYTAK